ncbi:unnamed protein product [Closterium sp. NIES-65]|nr:unnamed protein product [Closterium sp. NIES-65]
MPYQHRHVSLRQARAPLAKRHGRSAEAVSARASAVGRVEGGGGEGGDGGGGEEAGDGVGEEIDGGEVKLGGPTTATGDEAAVLARPQRRLELLLLALLTVSLGVANRVLYKLALIPLHRYPFFLAQLTTFGYVAVYSIILLIRTSLNIVTPDMLTLPKRPFMLMGLLEAAGLAIGMMAAAHMPGVLIPVLSQIFLVWQLTLSYVFLGRRYSPQQLLGCFLVIVGVAVVVVTSGPPLHHVSTLLASLLAATAIQWPLLFIVSTVFPAASSIIKESVFRNSAKKLNGRSLDIFVVNTFGSAFQALFVLILLPLISSLGYRVPPAQLPGYFREGAACLFNFNQNIPGCQGAPLLPLLYVAANLAFNISLLALLKKSSAVIASLSMTLTVLAFTLPLPLLGPPQPLRGGVILGTLVLLLGLAAYNLATPGSMGAGGEGGLKLAAGKED